MAAIGLAFALAPVAVRAQTTTNQAGTLIYAQQRQVGGISINADGLIGNASLDVGGKLGRLRDIADETATNPNMTTAMRVVSLARLDAVIQARLAAGRPLGDAVLLLGGLQQIRYVFVYPERHDIVLIGPAEGWKVDGRGNVVGRASGRPVMQLDDLLVALRTAAESAQTGITCSIDPTEDGVRQLRAQVSKLHTIGDPKETASQIEQALGRQQVSFSGVPATSHLASVLIAADYRMKRLAMNFEPSPVPGIRSFLQMLGGGGRGMSNMMQRWWLEPKYDAILRDPEGLAWQFDGAGVKCMTEEEFLAAGGQRERQSRPNPLAQRWADSMTKHYEELAVAEPVFGQLRNCMELAVVGALVARENLLEKAGCSLPTLMDPAGLKTAEMPAPRQVDSRVSMLKKGRNWIISASGGVSIHPGEFVQRAEKSDVPAAARRKAMASPSGKWCW